MIFRVQLCPDCGVQLFDLTEEGQVGEAVSVGRESSEWIDGDLGCGVCNEGHVSAFVLDGDPEDVERLLKALNFVHVPCCAL